MIREPFFRRFIAGAAIMCAISARGRAQPALEYDVKAALLLNFARFIEWPDAAFDGAQAPIDVCVFTPSPFGQALERALSGETVANRSVSARAGARRAGQCGLPSAVRAGRSRIARGCVLP